MKNLFIIALLLWILAGLHDLKGQQPSVAPAVSTNVAPQAPPTAADMAEFQRQLALAQAGDSQAQFQVGAAYYRGWWGTPINIPESYKWTLVSAKQGNAQAESSMAWYYDKGVSVPKDEAQSLVWRRKAAEDGDADSQVYLGWLYEKGHGVPLDLAEATKWYKKAAVQGSDKGMAAFGYALVTGQGVPKDPEAGFTYLLNAANVNAYARFAVARCYTDGVFVEQDLVQAYKWCLLALELDPKQAAQLAETIKSRLNAGQIAAAAKGVDAFHRQLKEHDYQTDDLSIVFAGDAPVTVPFVYFLRHILIPVQINNQETDYLMVDTGSDLTLLDADVSARLKAKASQYMPMMGTGSVLKLSRMADGMEFSLPGLKISGATAMLYPDFDLDQYLGHPVAGILGYDILDRMVVSIDYIHKKITFQKPETFKPDQSFEAIPLSTQQKARPFIQIGVGSKSGLDKGWFLVDSGDGDLLTLTKYFQEKNPQFEIQQAIKTGAWGIGGISYETKGKCSQLVLGKTVVLNPVITCDSQKQGFLANIDGGLMGTKLLERFDVIFDTPSATLFLKPNAKFADPFTYQEFGMGIKTAKGDYHSFQVYAVIPGSPAGVAGFQVGDQIMQIDGADTKPMDLADIYHKADDAGVHHLTVLRAGVSKSIDLTISETIK